MKPCFDLLAAPILVTSNRGHFRENEHRGAISIVSDDGAELAIGDSDRVVLPRSSLKIVQALPLIISGAAAAFNLSREELTLACASQIGLRKTLC